MISSFDFDGLIPKFDGNINAIDIKPGYMIQAVPGEYFPVVSVEYDEDGMEDTPSGIVTINYINDQGNTVSVDYDEADLVPVVYENWDEKSLGTQGWGITAGGNAIFTNVAVRGRIEAEEGYISGNLTIGSGGSTTLDDVATTDDLDGFITAPQLQDNVTIISGGNIQSGTISAITFQTNLSGRRSKLGAGNAYTPTNWNETIVPRTGGGSASYIPTGLEFFDQNGNRTGYFYSLDKYISGTFQSGSRLFAFGATDTSGNDTGTEILLSHIDIDLYAENQIDIRSGNGVRLEGDGNAGITVGSFGNEVYIDGQAINFSQDWAGVFGGTPSARFYSHIYAMSGYKYYGDGSELTNIAAGNAYKNATTTPTPANKITFGTGEPPGSGRTTGDIHLRYT
jgi:hypothetical protein